MSEHHEQVAVIRWARLLANQHPELRLLHAIPNGGLRNRNVGRKLKAEGVLAGIPDLCLPVPKPPYHGLYVELKYGRNKLSPAQQTVIAELEGYGYAVAVCYSANDAIDVIQRYITKPGEG